jgi:aminoglycoside phosphotransferase (APT) family kinase protein
MKGIDPRKVLRALGETAESAEPLAGGWDTAIWRVELDGRAGVLRLLRPTEQARGRREVLAMEAAVRAGVPAPEVLAQGEWQGRPALLLSWLPGGPLASRLRAEPERAVPLGLAFGRMLARLHATRAPEELHRRGAGWIAAAEAAESLAPEETPLQARLRVLAGDADAVLHLDYHPLNTLTDGDRITGVVDWANAAAGDPRADVARMLVLLENARRIFGPGLPPAARAARRRFRLAALRGYLDAGGHTEEMAPFLAWGWAATARDLAPNLGRPGHWLRPEHLALMHARAAAWKRRAGL